MITDVPVLLEHITDAQFERCWVSVVVAHCMEDELSLASLARSLVAVRERYRVITEMQGRDNSWPQLPPLHPRQVVVAPERAG